MYHAARLIPIQLICLQPMNNNQNLYVEFNVWKRRDEHSLIRYRCFQILPGGRYCVQSADFHYPYREDTDALFHAKQFLELLAEESPCARVGSSYDSLEEAIAAHDADFGV